MNKLFTDNSWRDYIYWEAEDKKTLKRINKLIYDISRNGNEVLESPNLFWEIWPDSGADG